MAGKLVTVALAGFGVAIVSTVITVSLGGPGQLLSQHRMHGLRTVFGDFVNSARVCDDGGQNISRNLPWTDNSGQITLNLAADVNWVPGTADQLTVSGPQSSVDQVQIDGNQIDAGCSPSDFHKLTITLPGRAFTHYQVNGVSRLHLSGLNQPAITFDISGAGSVDAAGIVPDTNVQVSGAASVDLANLITQNLRANMSGVSNLTANPAQSADLDLSGADSVKLLTRPKDYHANISGIAHVDVPDQPGNYE